MILKPGTSLILSILTASPSLDVNASVVEHSASAVPDDVLINTEITTTGDQTLVAAPGSGLSRQVQEITIVNKAAVAVQVQPRLGAPPGTTRAAGVVYTLAAGEALTYLESAGWEVINIYGTPRQTPGVQVLVSDPVFINKTGTAPESQGQYYCWAKDSGTPGAWSPGTPGLAGRVTDGTTAADAGCARIPNAGAGQTKFLTDLSCAATVAQTAFVFDLLLVNTGIVVTTTTAQTLNTVTLPARDRDGTTAGLDVRAALLITTATTNAGAIPSIAISYTNSDGVAGRTATIPSYPATAVLGTLVPFDLQAGDSGVRSVQTITLGNTLTSGAISLILYRTLAFVGQPAANFGVQTPARSGARLYNGACILAFSLASGTGASTINLQLTVETRI
jgi:hypothetical protein